VVGRRGAILGAGLAAAPILFVTAGTVQSARTAQAALADVRRT
jgi:hypothetical protein